MITKGMCHIVTANNGQRRAEGAGAELNEEIKKKRKVVRKNCSLKRDFTREGKRMVASANNREVHSFRLKHRLQRDATDEEKKAHAEKDDNQFPEKTVSEYFQVICWI